MRWCVAGEAQVEEDQAGMSAGGGRVLRRRHLEHLVRPRPDHRRPRDGQGSVLLATGVRARITDVAPESDSC